MQQQIIAEGKTVKSRQIALVSGFLRSSQVKATQNEITQTTVSIALKA